MAVSRRFFIEMLSENKQKKPLRMEEASTIPSATIAGTKTPIDVMREWIKSAKLTTDVESVWFEEDEDYLSLTGNLQANDEERGAKKQVRRFLEHSLGNAAVWGSAVYTEIAVLWAGEDDPDAKYTGEDEEYGLGTAGNYRLIQRYDYYVRWDKKLITEDTIKDIPEEFK